MPLIADLEIMMPHLVSNIERVEGRVPAANEYDDGSEGGTKPAGVKGGAGRSDAKAGAIRVVAAGSPVSPLPLDIDAKLTAEWLGHFVRHERDPRGVGEGGVGGCGGG